MRVIIQVLIHVRLVPFLISLTLNQKALSLKVIYVISNTCDPILAIEILEVATKVWLRSY